MEAKVKRTLVKSAPELWALADDRPRMEAWMAGIVGAQRPIPVEVTDREPGRVLAWRASERGDPNPSIALELAEKKGFGTSVSITAQHWRLDGAGVDATLERLLDELGAPGRRPFGRG
jgi:hypothetical protein